MESERVSDDFMEERGYAAMMSPQRRVRSLEDQPIGRGIDGVYAVPPEKQPPEYVITETKYRGGATVSDKDLSMTKGAGKQMSEDWIRDRLDAAVGREKAEVVREHSYEAWLMGVNETGRVTRIIKLGHDGNALRDVTGKMIEVPVN